MTICGSPRARNGRILLDGQDITRLPTHEIMHMGMAQSPEGRRIFARMTVHENLLMGAQVVGDARLRARRGSRCSRLFPRLKERLAQRGGTLSGGEQQMLAIGRALMSQPRLLLLDEPSLGLAPLVVRQIFGAIRQLNRETGLTVLLVEQNAFQALRLAHRGYVLVNGAITMAGPGRSCWPGRRSARPIWRAGIGRPVPLGEGWGRGRSGLRWLGSGGRSRSIAEP